MLHCAAAAWQLAGRPRACRSSDDVSDSDGVDFGCDQTANVKNSVPVQGLELLVAAVAVERLQDVRLDVRCDPGGIGLPGRVLFAELRREPLLTAARQQLARAVLPAILRNCEEGCRRPLAQAMTGQSPAPRTFLW
jgi:hypothetical protein